MSNIKKIAISSLFVSLLTTTLVVSTTAQAEGFFSRLFGGSDSSEKFESMLKHVPADTPFLFANKNAIPSDVMDFHIKRSENLLKMYSKILYKAKKSSDDKDKAVNKGEAFAEAIMSEFSSKLADKKFEETGFSLKARSVIYGYKEMPVVRFSIKDKTKLMEMVKRAEEESGYSVKFEKCGEFECFKDGEDGPKGASFAVVFLKDEIALALSDKGNIEDTINHLIGKADPSKSYDKDKWDDFLKENDYKGYGDGFFNWKQLYSAHKADFAKGFFQKKKELSDEEKAACIKVVDDHIDNMPGMIFGSKKLTAGAADYEAVIQTSTAVSDSLVTLANKTNIAKRAAKPIFDLGVNIDFKKLSEASAQYSKFLIASGEKHKCTSIDPKAIRKGVGGLLMGMNMGLSQFKSVYVSLNDIELDDRMKPKKVDVLLSIGSDDPSGLLAMGGMFIPGLAQLKIPDDGKAIELPASMIPSRGMPLPPMSISRSDKSINIMVGNDKPDLADYKGTTPEIMNFSLDAKRYYKIMGKVMKVITRKDKNSEDMAEFISAMGGMMGVIKQEISADKRGLVVDYHIQY